MHMPPLVVVDHIVVEGAAVGRVHSIAIFVDTKPVNKYYGPYVQYTQYPFIRNALIRNNAEMSGNFKKPAFKGSNLRYALK